jgi:hypothetical protein
MMGPVAALQKVRGSQLRERPKKNLDTFEIGVFVVVLVIVMGAWWTLPFARYRARGQVRLSYPVLMALLVPGVIVASVVIAYYRRWRTRGTVPFAFPLRLGLTRWRILEQDGDAALVLTDTEGVMSLIHRLEPGETLEQVLDALDPDNELVVDEDVSKETELRFELEGARPAAGLLRRCGDRSYVLVLVPPRRIDDLSGILAKAVPRAPGDAPQKWRTLSANDVIVTKRA